jgi:hypothetical protein
MGPANAAPCRRGGARGGARARRCEQQHNVLASDGGWCLMGRTERPGISRSILWFEKWVHRGHSVALSIAAAEAEPYIRFSVLVRQRCHPLLDPPVWFADHNPGRPITPSNHVTRAQQISRECASSMVL